MTSALSVEFDPSEEPKFRGSLAVEVRGVDAGGQTRFETRIDITVANRRTVVAGAGRAGKFDGP